jgi:hypothetical protein
VAARTEIGKASQASAQLRGLERMAKHGTEWYLADMATILMMHMTSNNSDNH